MRGAMAIAPSLHCDCHWIDQGQSLGPVSASLSAFLSSAASSCIAQHLHGMRGMEVTWKAGTGTKAVFPPVKSSSATPTEQGPRATPCRLQETRQAPTRSVMTVRFSVTVEYRERLFKPFTLLPCWYCGHSLQPQLELVHRKFKETASNRGGDRGVYYTRELGKEKKVTFFFPLLYLTELY